MSKDKKKNRRAVKKDSGRYPHSVYLNEEYEKKLKFLMDRNFVFTKLVKAIIDDEYEKEIQEWAKEQYEKTVEK